MEELLDPFHGGTLLVHRSGTGGPGTPPDAAPSSSKAFSSPSCHTYGDQNQKQNWCRGLSTMI